MVKQQDNKKVMALSSGQALPRCDCLKGEYIIWKERLG
jgi:hypothetical protein